MLFDVKFHLSERVDEVKKNNNNWQVKTNKGTEFSTPNIIIAGGVGSFEPSTLRQWIDLRGVFPSVRSPSGFPRICRRVL